MKKTIEEEGEEGDEPKIEEFDEEKENEETKKNMKKGKKVFHEWEHLIMNELLRGCRCRQWRFFRFSSRRSLRTFCLATETGTHSANCVVGVRVAAVYGGVYCEVAGMGGSWLRCSGFCAPPGRLELSASLHN